MFTARYKTTSWLWSGDKCPFKKESRQPWRPNCREQSKNSAFDSCANEGAGMTLEVPRKSWSWVSGAGCIRWGRAHSSDTALWSPSSHLPCRAIDTTPFLLSLLFPNALNSHSLEIKVDSSRDRDLKLHSVWVKSKSHYGCKALDLKIRKLRYIRMRWNHPKRKHIGKISTLRISPKFQLND